MEASQLKNKMPAAALAFRGYNLTNLGRTPELLSAPAYAPILEDFLARASWVCREVSGRKVDLIDRVRRMEETSLDTYDEAIALVVAVELAQLAILRECFDVDYVQAKLAYGYSLGEISALIAGGMVEMEAALRIPLSLADDCVELAADVTLGVLFTRKGELPLDQVRRQCLAINEEGRGVIGMSTILSPNSALLLGQGDTLDRFAVRINDVVKERVYLRKNDGRWPPLHTPITWRHNIPNRASQLMHTMAVANEPPKPPVFSLVTGQADYNPLDCRATLGRWIDHPQRLWDAVYATLSQGVETVIHVGPAPNILPATFRRLTENVESQLKASLGLRAVSGMVTRPWIKRLLPARSALLRAPSLSHVVLEDWLLEKHE
ncbi:MAG: hypothetical protein RIC55_02685 [Pirellulaceae bacterium]